MVIFAVPVKDNMPKQWFHDWFNSPYYHQLYNKRDRNEAGQFIDNLLAYLKPANDAHLLDIACGRGRHAVYLNKRGYHVTGIDLSIANIGYAKQFENDSLHFFVHDMRSLFYTAYFDIAFNLFTSFGYFETDEEHICALKAFNMALKPGGLLVLDFFNSNKITRNLVHEEVKIIDDIQFHIHKKIEGKKIIKSIEFEHEDKTHTFKEAVSIFNADDFVRFFAESGFEIIDQFGSYSLEQFDTTNSDRLIFICKKANA
ncbi:class I SAM-dependent methyltransferase [soil metagenome]